MYLGMAAKISATMTLLERMFLVSVCYRYAFPAMDLFQTTPKAWDDHWTFSFLQKPRVAFWNFMKAVQKTS